MLSGQNNILYQSLALICPLWCSPSDPPQISGSEDVAVEEESDLLLQCDIEANPPVANTSWTLNGEELDLAAGGFTVTNDGFKIQLLASRVEKSLHEGTYACSAYSDKYGQHTKTFSVTLTGQFTQSVFWSHIRLIWRVKALTLSTHDESIQWREAWKSSLIIYSLHVCRKDHEVPTDSHHSRAGGGVPYVASCLCFALEEDCKGNTRNNTRQALNPLRSKPPNAFFLFSQCCKKISKWEKSRPHHHGVSCVEDCHCALTWSSF